MMALIASCLLNRPSALSVIFTNGPKILIGPSIRKKKVKVSPRSTCDDEILEQKEPLVCALDAFASTTVKITPIVANGVIGMLPRI